MPVPSVDDFNNAKIDVDDLASIINGSTTVTTRLGGDKLSVDQALSQIIVGEVTAYSAAAQYTAIEEWVEYSGAMYRPKPSQLPIGPEVFDSGKWSAVNGLNLANIEGNQNSVVRSDMNAYLDNQQLADYTALRGLITTSFVSGNEFFNVVSRNGNDQIGGGEFVWFGQDLSAEVAKDPLSGVIVAPDSDLSGASGAFVRRIYRDLSVLFWEDGVTDGINDNSTAFQAACDYVNANITAGGTAGGAIHVPGGPGRAYSVQEVLIKAQGTRIYGDGRFNTEVRCRGGRYMFATDNLSGTNYINEITIERLQIKFTNNLDDSSLAAAIILRFSFGNILRDLHISRGSGTEAHNANGLFLTDGNFTTQVMKCSIDRVKMETVSVGVNPRMTTGVFSDCEFVKVNMSNVDDIDFFACANQAFIPSNHPQYRYTATDCKNINIIGGDIESDIANDVAHLVTRVDGYHAHGVAMIGYNPILASAYMDITDCSNVTSKGNTFLSPASPAYEYIRRAGTNKRLRLMDRNFNQNASVGEIEFTGRTIMATEENPLVDTTTLGSDSVMVAMSRAFTTFNMIGANNSSCIIKFGDQDNLSSGEINYSHVTDEYTIRAGGNPVMQINGSGQITFVTLPTSAPAGSGKVWNDSGTLKIT